MKKISGIAALPFSKASTPIIMMGIRAFRGGEGMRDRVFNTSTTDKTLFISGAHGAHYLKSGRTWRGISIDKITLRSEECGGGGGSRKRTGCVIH